MERMKNDRQSIKTLILDLLHTLSEMNLILNVINSQITLQVLYEHMRLNRGQRGASLATH